MKGFKADIFEKARENTNFRQVLYTSEFSQLVLMSLSPGEEIGQEVHGSNDQFFRVEAGEGGCVIDGQMYDIREGDAIVVPRGARHNIMNTSENTALKLYTIYSPPHHKDGIIRKTKAEAEAMEAEFDGVTTETSSNVVQGIY